jgi:hypothetical protein
LSPASEDAGGVEERNVREESSAAEGGRQESSRAVGEHGSSESTTVKSADRWNAISLVGRAGGETAREKEPQARINELTSSPSRATSARSQATLEGISPFNVSSQQPQLPASSVMLPNSLQIGRLNQTIRLRQLYPLDYSLERSTLSLEARTKSEMAGS